MKTIELTLKYPEDIVSLSTVSVKISNMNECVNLINMYSRNSIYNSAGIVSLANMRKIYSFRDKNEQSGNFFLFGLPVQQTRVRGF